MDNCPTGQKVGVYPTWELAAHALRTIRHKRVRSNAPFPNHIYACSCGNFHLTSQTSDQVNARRAKARRLQKLDRKERKHRR